MRAYFEGDKDVLVFKPIPASKIGRPRKNVADTNVVKTNADHIRSMTDEELELWLVRFCRAAEDCIVCPIDDCPHERNKRWIEWLKQPYKEEA